MSDFISTSIARRLMARIHSSHDRRRIAVFAGPPGIGKTTAIDALAGQLAGAMVVVKISRRNAREVMVLRHVLEGLRGLAGSRSHHASTSVWELRSDIFNAACAWAGVDANVARRGEHPQERYPRLTIVFDEAQNLSREAIESLRFWNDSDRCYAPFPLGLIFVGNNEFSLQTDLDGRSVISAAVADRALYVQTFDYSDVTDDDVRLYVEARGIVDEGAVRTLIAYLDSARVSRSFRRIEDLIHELIEIANARPVTAGLVREALAIA
jgi:type II secretory pathway predicted ATPase ExeA